MKGWISLHRKILENPIIATSKIFSRFEAWIWLLLNANHARAKVVIGSEMFVVERGSMITSQKKLCKQFKWGNSKLRSFLKLLEKDDMIKVKTTSILTCISIMNYDTYQDSKPEPKRNQTDNKLRPNTNNKKFNNKYNNVYKNNSFKFKKFEPSDGDIGSPKYWENWEKEEMLKRKKAQELDRILAEEEKRENIKNGQ